MASQQAARYSSFKRQQSTIIATVTITIALAHIITTAVALYIPDMHVARYRPVTILRRADGDDDGDELDRGASSPTGEGSGGGATDGYEDGEPDGPYDETPRDEEGQADLERFFDDHLGASERDGMDKENLPSNLVPFVVANPEFASELERNIVLESDKQAAASQPQPLLAMSSNGLPINSNNNNNMQYYNHQNQIIPNIETRYMQLPNKKLIITRQITRGPVYKGGLDLSDVPAFFKLNDHTNFDPNQPRESLDANGSEIVATEDDDSDRIYVTNNTKKPFRIPALNGYDPEEDFQEASRDFEEPAKRDRSGERRRSSEPESEIKDISFNDPETDTLFNDASETDEVIFAQDPYQNDLEAELRGDLPASEQSSSTPEEDDQSNSQEQPSAQADSSAEQPVARQQQTKEKKKKKQPNSTDEDDGSWINDGVEDIDVPSQSYQNAVLEKAARREELAKQASPDESKQQHQQGEQEEPENQRMPNADYLKEDMNVDGFEDNLDD